MTDPEQRVIHANEFTSKEVAIKSQGKSFCPAFSCNLRSVVDLSETEIKSLHRKIRDIELRMESCKKTIENAQRNSTKDGNEGQRLREILTIIDVMLPAGKNQNMNNYQNTRTGLKRPTFFSPLHINELGQKFQMLQQYHKEYIQFGLANLAPALIFPKLQQQFLRWEPFKAPAMPKVVLKPRRLLSTCNLPNKRDLYTVLIEDTIIPHLTRVIQTQWDVQHCISCMQLLEENREVLPEHVLHNLLDSVIMPRLQQQIDCWDPYAGFAPMDHWILPWTSWLTPQKMKPLFSMVRRRISRWLQLWRITDPGALNWVQPFLKAEVWQEDDLKLLFAEITPKLEKALRDSNKKNNTLFLEVQKWEHLFSHVDYVALLQRAFFPYWFQVLHSWLSDPHVDCSQIKQWYTSWRDAFSPQVRKNLTIVEQFCTSLDMINWAMDGKGTLPSLEIILENMNCGIKTPLPSNLQKRKQQTKPLRS
eukprot:UN24520